MRETIYEFLKKHDSFWKWDGHKHIAQLTSGKLSNVYINCTPIFEYPYMQKVAGQTFCDLALSTEPIRRYLRRDNVWVVGSAMGAIGLAQSTAYALGNKVRAAYTEPFKSPDGSKHMTLKRFNLGIKPVVFVVEDVISTGGTTKKTIEAIHSNHPDAIFFPYVLCVINRSADDGLDVDDLSRFIYLSILDVEVKTWNSVSDLPPDMQKCIPVRPKEDWKKLTSLEPY